MGRRRRASAVIASLVVATLVAGPARAQQQVGHKALGTLGLQAGSQVPVGLYLVDQVAYYHSSEVVDRNGHAVPVGLDLDLLANTFGVAATLELPRIATYVGASVGVPVVYLNASTQNPRLSVEPRGIGDLVVQPLKLGWRPGPLESSRDIPSMPRPHPSTPRGRPTRAVASGRTSSRSVGLSTSVQARA